MRRYRCSLVCFAWTCFACVIVGLAGCDIPDRPPLSPRDLESELNAGQADSLAGGEGLASQTGTSAAQSSEPLEPYQFDQPWEAWHAYYLGDHPIGYKGVTATVDESTGDIRYETDEVLFIRQGKARTLRRWRQTSLEKPDGRLLGFDGSTQNGPVLTRYDGMFSGVDGEGTLSVESRLGNKSTTRTIPWENHYRGLVAIEQTLRHQPLTKQGASRTMTMLLPGKYQLAERKLFCNGDAMVPMLGGKTERLVEITCMRQEGDSNFLSTIWTDQQGNVRRTYLPGIDVVAYRCDKATAKKILPSVEMQDEAGDNSGDREISLFNPSVILPIEGSIDRPAKATRVAFELTPYQRENDTTPKDTLENFVVISPFPGQYTRILGKTRYQVLVSRRNETKIKGFKAFEGEPTDADLAPNYFVNFNDVDVRRLSIAAIAASSLNQRELAIEMTGVAQSMIGDDPAAAGLVQASDVARSNTTSATGKAILLTALLRAKKIPARVAIGLRYQPGTPARMHYHMWTLAYADGQWIHLDPVLGDIAPPDRLVLSTTPLNEADADQVFVPLFNAVSRMQIKVVNAAY